MSDGMCTRQDLRLEHALDYKTYNRIESFGSITCDAELYLGDAEVSHFCYQR
jgi:hypothetical protein